MGLYAFIAGTRATTASEYTAKWLEARRHFPDSVDTSTADGSHNLNRLRYVCHDPDAYLADFVTPLTLTATEPERQPKGKGKGNASQQGEWQPGSPEKARAALAYVRRPVSGGSDYAYFRNMIWAMKDAGITRPDAEAWAAGYTNASRVPEIWNQDDGRPGGITAGDLLGRRQDRRLEEAISPRRVTPRRRAEARPRDTAETGQPRHRRAGHGTLRRAAAVPAAGSYQTR